MSRCEDGFQNSNPPFFSVVIPTRNRSNLLRYALISLKRQSFEDFEVIVSDNGTNRLAKDVFDEFCDDRFRYVRPDKDLCMSDNWELGLSFAKGVYVTVLEDKMFYYYDALENYYDAISNSGWPDTINCNVDSFAFADEMSGRPNGWFRKKMGEDMPFTVYNSEDVIEEKLNCEWCSMYVHNNDRRKDIACGGGMGSLMGGMIRNKIFGVLRAKYGRVFDAYSPDYGIMLLTLSEAKKSVALHQNQIVYIESATSNGLQCMINAESMRDFIETHYLGAERTSYAVVPYMLATNQNMVTADYNYAMEKVGSNKRCNKVNWLVAIKNDFKRVRAWGSMENECREKFDREVEDLSVEDKALYHKKVTRNNGPVDSIDCKTTYVDDITQCIDRKVSGGTVIESMLNFCDKYENVYCYGAGDWGQKVSVILLSHEVNMRGFIVTSKTEEYVDGIPVFGVDEIEGKGNDVGIVLSLSPLFHEEVIATLKSRNLNNYFVVRWLF